MAQAQLADSTASLYAQFTVGRHRLLLPQGDIRSLESVLDVTLNAPLAKSVGWIVFQGENWPVYSLDEDLKPQSERSAKQRICALLSIADGYVGLLCEDSATRPRAGARVQPLPAAMAQTGSFVHGFALYPDGVGLLSSAAALAAFLEAPARDVPPV